MNRPVGPLRRGEDNVFVEVASTANLTLSGEQTIDGRACVSGDYVLVWKQDDETENGVYQVRDADWYFMGQIGLVAVRLGSSYKESMFGLTDVDTYKQLGGPGVKLAKATASTNLALSGTSSIDSTSIAAGDFVLARGQTTTTQNGLYEVAAGAWTFLGQPDVVVIKAGSTWGRSMWFLLSANTYAAVAGVWR